MSSQHREPGAIRDETLSPGRRSAEPITRRKDFENGSEDDLEMQSALDAAKTNGFFAIERDHKLPIELSDNERNHGFYIIGASGTGKTTLLENLAISDIRNNYTVIFIDLHGDAARRLSNAIPPRRIEQFCLMDFSDTVSTLSFNPIAEIPHGEAALTALTLTTGLKDIWADAWSERMSHFLRNGLALLIEKKTASLNDLRRLYVDADFRKRLTIVIQNPDTRDFWKQEYDKYSKNYQSDAPGPVISRLTQLLAIPHVRKVFCQRTSTFRTADALRPGAITVINLAKGKVSQPVASIIGSFLVSGFKTALFAREAIPKDDRTAVRIYCDEFQNYGSQTFVDMPSELRKYGLHLTLANQYADQISQPLLRALLENIPNVCALRVGVDTAERIRKQFIPNLVPLNTNDLTELPNYCGYLKRGSLCCGIRTAPAFDTLGTYDQAISASKRRFSR